jgi:hypothetical protein
MNTSELRLLACRELPEEIEIRKYGAVEQPAWIDSSIWITDREWLYVASLLEKKIHGLAIEIDWLEDLEKIVKRENVEWEDGITAEILLVQATADQRIEAYFRTVKPGLFQSTP